MEATLDTILENLQTIRDSVSRLWRQSKFFRIISIVSGSFTLGLSLRPLYIATYRAWYNLPKGKMGMIPLLGNSLQILDRDWLINMMQYGSVASYMMGPYHGLLLNEPSLAKKFYLDSRAVDVAIFNPELAETAFATANGKAWSERRRIIYANLMSTMKAAYVEKATKKFIQTKVFPEFDQAANNNEIIKVKPLFRPIGFNIVLQACFGKELSSLKDPFWLTWDKKSTENAAKATVQGVVFFMLGDGKLSTWIQKLLTGSDFMSDLDEMIDIIDGLFQSRLFHAN